MTVIVRPGVFETDRHEVVDLLTKHLNPDYDEARFDWLHRRNPAGSGRLWIAEDTTTGEVVGTAAAFPRGFSVEGRDALCWVLGDFCVSDRYRALGPALKLQRLCLGLAEDAGTFCYDFPSHAMMPVYARLRIAPAGQMRRFVKVLRVDGKFTESMGRSLVARGVGWAVNRFLAVAARPRRLPSGLAIAVHEGPCGAEFSLLAEQESASYGVCLKRTAAHLNWRYLDNPLAHHRVLTARRHGRLVAYTIFTVDRDTATLVDLFGAQDETVLAALVQAAATVARHAGCGRLNVTLLESHAWVRLFHGLGFVPRECSPLVVSRSPELCVTTGGGPGRLFVMSGDRDS